MKNIIFSFGKCCHRIKIFEDQFYKMANSLKLDFGEARQGKYGYEVKDTMNKYYIRNRAEKFEILLKKKQLKAHCLV